MGDSGTKGFIAALIIHGLIFGALAKMSAHSGNESTNSDVDPIMLLLPGDDDPTRDAGIVGNERGIARGTQDGKFFDPGKYTEEHLEELAEIPSEPDLEPPATPDTPEQEVQNVNKEPPSPQKNTKPLPQETKKETTKTNKNNKPGKATNREVVSIDKILKERKNSGNTKKPGTGKKNSGGKNKVSGVRVSTGNVIGTATGTGGNGGDGGSRVANAQALYADAVAKIFTPHFEDVVARNPVSLPKSVTVAARFSVDKRGNIKFLEIVGSSDPQLRERVRCAFERAFPTKFRTPPEGNAFTGRINGITFVID